MLKKRKTLTLPEIRRFVMQICGAVKYLHHRHIVHRDLKTGNLFLDQEMNVKVGDFGLAALLVTEKEMEVRRRTTMCGTPNYLAPEILEKGKGHDEKVDLWAIGVIAYTLAVGKAPFHASTKEEIYKKLKSGTYTWPELSGKSNQSSDLRNLVSTLLVQEDQRPIPDQIVSQNFFKIAYVPERIPASAREKPPTWPDVLLPSSEVLRRGYTDTWFAAALESGVGEYEPGKFFRLPGGKRVRSIVYDIEQDAILGRQPTMPIPKDVVYESTVSQWDAPSSNGPTVVDLTSDEEKQSSSRGLREISHNEVAKPRPTIPRSKTTRDAELMPPPPKPGRTGTVRKAARTISEEAAKQAKLQPHRQVESQEAVPPPTATSTLKASLARRPKAPPKEPSTKKSLPKDQSSKEIACKEPISKHSVVRELASKIENAADAILSLPAPPQMITKKLPVPRKASDSTKIDPEAVSGTDPNVVLQRLGAFRDNLASAIHNTASARTSSAEAHRLPFVSRWVDYSRKHGVGYVLSDGTVGCIINASSKFGGTPVTHVIVRNGQKWLARVGKNLENSESVPLEIFEDCGAAGLRRKVYKGLGSVKEGPLKDEADRRRTLTVLWVKFGRYMSKTLDGEDIDPNVEKSDSFVRFYQRIGDVGIWVFTDGCMQVRHSLHSISRT
jgi:serine/threonine protein kinase